MISQGHHTPPSSGGHGGGHGGGHPGSAPTRPAAHHPTHNPVHPSKPRAHGPSKPAAHKPSAHKPTPPGRKTAARFEIELAETVIPVLGLKQGGHVH